MADAAIRAISSVTAAIRRDPRWPGDARIAVQFVVNYEEGGENNILHGDRASEAFLSDMVGAQPWPGQRHANMESIYEYGSRAGFWRLWRMFTERKLAGHGVRRRHGVAAQSRSGRGDEGGRLGYRQSRPEMDRLQGHDGSEERAHIAEAIRVHTEATGERPLGWYTGRTSSNTDGLVLEDGGFLYHADSYADDLPYWVKGPTGRN